MIVVSLSNRKQKGGEIFVDYEKLYNAYFMKIYSFVLLLVKNPDLAEEIAQETFFKALKANKQFEGKSSEYTWLCAIAKNIAYDVLKKHKKHEMLGDDVPDELDFQQEIENKETAFRIHEYLHNMEDRIKKCSNSGFSVNYPLRILVRFFIKQNLGHALLIIEPD